MHVLGNIGHSFSQRRKTPKPKDLHIRKVSFSGCSLSSDCSISSSSSTSTARPPFSARTTASSSSSSSSTSSGYNPLHSHPTFQPPPRLHDRPLISPERPRHQPASTFFDDSTDEEYDEQGIDEDYTLGNAQELHFSHPKEMMLPPHTSPMDHSVDVSEPQDYFAILLAKRPPMPRSRWSESTIQSIQSLDQGMSSDDYDFESTSDSVADVPLEIPNFSHKRNVAPKRPPMRSLDSLDDLIKRSGWKRRGVVFNESEVEGN